MRTKPTFIYYLFAAAVVLHVGPLQSNGTIPITLDTGGASVNVIDAHFTFDPSLFTIARVSDGGSFIGTWIMPPTFSNTSGTLDLTGFIPGGVNTASGTLVTITILPSTSMGVGQFAVASATVFLNDGEGTPAPLSVVSNPFSLQAIMPTSASSAVGLMPVDTQPPDIFTPEIASDPNIFGGKYFLVFAATDRGVGIAYYQVMEGSNGWVTASSPYLLTDQLLSSNIYVRAVDTNGNFRVVEVSAPHPHPATGGASWSWEVVLAALALLLIGGIAWLIWKQKRI